MAVQYIKIFVYIFFHMGGIMEQKNLDNSELSDCLAPIRGDLSRVVGSSHQVNFKLNVHIAKAFHHLISTSTWAEQVGQSCN